MRQQSHFPSSVRPIYNWALNWIPHWPLNWIPNWAVLAAACLVARHSAAAQTVVEWVSQQGGAFSDPANWSPAPPGPADTCLFELDARYPIEVDVASLVGRLIVREGTVALGLGSPLVAGSATALLPSIVVGDSPARTPALLLEHGALSGQHMEVGSPPGASGAVAIAGDSTLILAKLLLVGPRGTGTVAANGQVAAQRIVLGSLASGHGEVAAAGPDAQVVVEQLTTVGQKGVGLMHLAAGAALASDEAIVALDVFSTGGLVLEGPGTAATFASSLDVGRNGVGSLLIENGATVTCGADCILGTIPQSFNFPQFPGGDGTLIVEGTGSLLHVGADLVVPLGGKAAVEIGSGGAIAVAGTLLFNRPLGAQLAFELEGPPAGGSPLIAVAGAVNSTLADAVATTVTLAPRCQPGPGDVFTLIAASSITSTFAVTAPPLDPPLLWLVAIETAPGSAALRLRVSTIFDQDGSGAVDGADLGLLLAAWGTDGPGDFDGSGSVDGADLGLLLGAWMP